MTNISTQNNHNEVSYIKRLNSLIRIIEININKELYEEVINLIIPEIEKYEEYLESTTICLELKDINKELIRHFQSRLLLIYSECLIKNFTNNLMEKMENFKQNFEDEEDLEIAFECLQISNQRFYEELFKFYNKDIETFYEELFYFKNINEENKIFFKNINENIELEIFRNEFSEFIFSFNSSEFNSLYLETLKEVKNEIMVELINYNENMPLNIKYRLPELTKINLAKSYLFISEIYSLNNEFNKSIIELLKCIQILEKLFINKKDDIIIINLLIDSYIKIADSYEMINSPLTIIYFTKSLILISPTSNNFKEFVNETFLRCDLFRIKYKKEEQSIKPIEENKEEEEIININDLKKKK